MRLHKYFREILKEFFNVGTPVFYRVHLSSPKTILEEIKIYAEETRETKHINTDHIKKLAEEYLSLNKKDIVFQSFEKKYSDFNKYVHEIFVNGKDETCKKNINELLNRIEPTIQYLNENYYKKSQELVWSILKEEEEKIKDADFTKLKKACFSYSTEILRRGYSKYYIYQQTCDLLPLGQEYSYSDFENFSNLFTQSKKEFTIIFKVHTRSSDIIKILERKYGNDFYEKLDPKLKNEPNNIQENPYWHHAFSRFIKEKSFTDYNTKKEKQCTFYIQKKIKSVDYVSAIEKAQKEIYVFFDSISLEFPKGINFSEKFAICFYEEEIKFHSIIPQLDGHKKPASIEFFKKRDEKITNILESKYVDNSTKEKIKTIIKYHRYFIESETLEHKFINLWIGWEHVFSLYGDSNPTWTNIHTIFPKIHAIHFMKNIFLDMINVQYIRNADPKNALYKKQIEKDLHTIISDNKKYQLGNLYSLIKKRNEDWNSLLNLHALKDDDLTKVKLFRLKERIKDPKEFIRNKKKQVEWDLFRMYRVRNAIVHRGDPYFLNIPLEIVTSMLETYYSELFDVILCRLSVNQRFKNIEQLFLSYEKTFNSLTSEKNKLSSITEPIEVESEILNISLIF